MIADRHGLGRSRVRVRRRGPRRHRGPAGAPALILGYVIAGIRPPRANPGLRPRGSRRLTRARRRQGPLFSMLAAPIAVIRPALRRLQRGGAALSRPPSRSTPNTATSRCVTESASQIAMRPAIAIAIHRSMRGIVPQRSYPAHRYAMSNCSSMVAKRVRARRPAGRQNTCRRADRVRANGEAYADDKR